MPLLDYILAQFERSSGRVKRRRSEEEKEGEEEEEEEEK